MKIICPLCNFTEGDFKESIGKYKLYKCNKCELVFVYPLPNEDELNKYYKKFNYSLGFENEHQIREDSGKTLINLRYLTKTGKNLLDIGCGAGFFLDEAKKVGFVVKGVDISNEVVKYARNNLKLNVFQANFSSIHIHDSQRNKYDAVALIQLIEHITNPHRLIGNVYKVLKPGGIVCIATPNTDSWLCKILKSEYNYLIPPEHVVYYNQKTLAKLLNSHKLNPVKIRTCGYPDDMYRITTKLVRGKLQSKIEIESNKGSLVSKSKKEKETVKRKILNIFCNSSYPVLNIGHQGSMIEIYAEKIS